MRHKFDCSCYKCGHSWQHDARKLWKEGGGMCPSCGLWIPLSDEARSTVEFVAALDRAGGGPVVPGADFVDALKEMDQPAKDRGRNRKRWWQAWK